MQVTGEQDFPPAALCACCTTANGVTGIMSHAVASLWFAACLLQLCHLAAVMTAQRSERVYYFDTTNSFSASRLQQLSEASSPEVRQPAFVKLYECEL